MKWYIVDQRQQPLSCFIHNDRTGKNQLRYRKHDYMFFSEYSEAVICLANIIQNCLQPKQTAKLRISAEIN